MLGFYNKTTKIQQLKGLETLKASVPNKASPFKPCLGLKVELLTVKNQETDNNSFIVIMSL